MSTQNIVKFLFVTILCITTSQTQATVVGITNGDFEAQQGTSSSVADWFERAGFSDFTVQGTNANRLDDVNTSVVAGLGNSGFLYQQIGTYSPNENVNLSGVIYRSKLHNLTPDIKFSLFSGDVTAGDGSDLNSRGAVLLASQTYTATSLGFDAPQTNPATSLVVNFNTVLNSGNTGVTGSKLWLQIDAFTNGNEIYFDNLVAVGNANPTPEPGSITLMLVGGLFAVGIMRRHC